MKTDQISWKYELRLIFLLSLLAFFFAYTGLFASAALNKYTPPATEGLLGGAFIYWIHEMLVEPPEKVNQEIVNPTVKKTRSLANEEGEKQVFAKDGKVGIGTANPSEILEISGETPRVLISSAQNPNLKMIAKSGEGKVFFDQASKQIVFLKDSVRFGVGEDGKVQSTVDIQENGITIVKAKQRCANGLHVRAFDENGNIVCQ